MRHLFFAALLYIDDSASFAAVAAGVASTVDVQDETDAREVQRTAA